MYTRYVSIKMALICISNPSQPHNLSEEEELHFEQVLQQKELEEFATRVLPRRQIFEVLEIDEDRRETAGPVIFVVKPPESY